MSLYKITNLFFLVSFLFFNSISLGAQESEDSRAAIEELVVTSQKRTQGTDAQDTGIAINHVTDFILNLPKAKRNEIQKKILENIIS